MVNGTPEIVLNTLEPDEHRVEVPLVPWSWSWLSSSRAIGKALVEFPAPAPHGPIGDGNAPLGQEQFNIPQAETEHVMQPHSVAYDVGGEAIAVVWVGWSLHVATLARLPAKQPDPVIVTMPAAGALD